MTQQLFQQINNALLDLQQSEHQTYERPLGRLGQLLSHVDLEPHNAKLTNGLSLDEFLSASEKTGTGMSGSHKLAWPSDAKQELGISLLLIQRLTADPRMALNFSHNYYSTSRKLIDGIHAMTRQLLIPFVRDYKAYIESQLPQAIALAPARSNRVFIVHGHDEGARELVARFLDRLGLVPIILHEQANQGRTIIEKVEAHGDVAFAIVLLTPDDEGYRRGDAPAPRARQNVLLELGYFLGRLGRSKVCALRRGNVEIPSDFAGVVWESFDEGGGWKAKLARELEAAGHSIDWNLVMR